MLSIGWVMFWKAVVVAVWLAITESWLAYRKRRKAQGLPMRYSRRIDAYVESDWTEWLDNIARWPARHHMVRLGYGMA